MTKLDNILKSREITSLTKAHLVKGLSVSPHPMYQFYQTQCMYDITATICMTPYAPHMTSQPRFMTSHHFMKSGPIYLTSHPLYLTSRPLYLCHHTHTIDDITATICMISHPVYVWHHIHISMTWYPLCMTSQNCVFMTTHAAYVWYHLHYRERHIHSITQNHSIYDVTSTSGMTSHPLYLCHHNLSMDIIPTFVWHQTHYICDII